MSAHPDELEVKLGDVDTGLRVQNPSGNPAPEPERHYIRLKIALGLTTLIVFGLVTGLMRLGKMFRDPQEAHKTTVATAAGPKTRLERAQDTGVDATKLMFTWLVPSLAVCLLGYGHQRHKVKMELARVEIEKRRLVVPNRYGQWPMPLEEARTNTRIPEDANNKHLDNLHAEASREIVSKVHTYAPRYDGPRSDGFDPLTEGRGEPMRAYTLLDLVRANVISQELLIPGVDENGDTVEIPYEHHGGALIFGKSQYGKTTVAKSGLVQVLYAFGDALVIDPDREHTKGLTKGIGPLAELLLLPPARTPEEIAGVIDVVWARYAHAKAHGITDHVFIAVDELLTLLGTTPEEYLPKELRESLTGLIGELFSHGPKYGFYLEAISHLANQKDTGGTQVRPRCKTSYLFNMEASQARMAADLTTGDPTPETGKLRIGECWLKYVGGDMETHFVKIRTPMCPPEELPELYEIIAARRDRLERGPAGLLLPPGQEQALQLAAAQEVTSGTRVINGHTGPPPKAIPQREEPPDPEYPHVQADAILQAFHREHLKPKQIVEKLWGREFSGGALNNKCEIVYETLRRYSGWDG